MAASEKGAGWVPLTKLKALYSRRWRDPSERLDGFAPHALRHILRWLESRQAEHLTNAQPEDSGTGSQRQGLGEGRQ